MPESKKLKFEVIGFNAILDIVDLFKELLDEYRIQAIAAGDLNAESKIEEYKARMIEIFGKEGF